MKKQLRKLLSALLVLTMLLSALPMGVFAEEEHTPVAADELTEETMKELNADPTAEPTEEPAAEPTVAPAPGAAEAPAAQPTVAPIVDSNDDALENATAGEPETEPEKEPAVQPTVAPIVDLTDDALETATAGEPETEPEKEPETTPAAEDEVDEGKPEETPAPAENNDDDTLSGLTDEQRKTLSSLPEGFSADVVAFAMLRSTGCAHTLLKVGQDSDSESYTSIDSKKHLFTQKNLSRKLFCSACGEVLQTIELGDSESEESHSWYSDGNFGGSMFDFTCLDCDEKITINPPCSHGSYSLNKNRTPYCTECGAIAYPGESMTMDDLCKHTHYTVHYPNTKLTEYSRWNDASHLKTTKVAQYTDDSESSQYYPAVCNDCGADLVYLPSGKVEQLEGYDGELWGDMEYVQTASDFEAHTFANGVCKYCGEKQSEETCQHTETKRVENTGKRTTKLTSLNDTEHEVTTTKYYELHCATCDAYISDDGTDTTTDKQSHDFGSGNTCACGYTKTEETCQHTETKRVENTGKRTTKLTSLNDTEHEVTTTKYYELHCAVCDAYISDDGEDTTTEKQSHDFSSGTTCACGYMKAQETCQHVNVSVESYPERTYTKLDEKKHICTLVFKTRELYCHDCERTLQTISYNKTFSVEVEHDWLWAGSMGGSIYDFICDACDTTITLTPPCSHGSFQNSDADGLLCTVCGKQFGPYVDDGPVNECKHTSYTIIYPGVEETRYDQWNADSHLKKTMISYYVDDDTTWGYDATCNDCGANLIYENGKIDDTIYSGRSGVDYKSIKSVFEAHSFVDGVCEHCGEKQTDESCQHKETKRVENTDKRTTKLTSLNETEHEVTTTKCYELHCAACDAYISDDGTDATTEKQPHDFGSGTTCACGYTKVEETCQHPETKRVENTGKRTTKLTSLNETEHEVTTTKYYELHCTACDAYISDDGEDTTTEKQSHDFSSGMTCACGYVKVEETCQHTRTKRVESVGSRKTELISLNDAEHEVKTTKTFKIRCAACDAYIRDDGTETTTVNKPHDFGNGNTCACGYTKVETPEDAPYVLGFTMSVTEIEVDGTVTFTLSIANAKDGDKLAIEMRADDKFTVNKEVTVKNGKASCIHKFTNTGDRSIKFRVAGGEYCAAQTLKVLPKKTGTSAITGVRVSPPINEARVEKKDGETFTVIVDCNLDTVCVEMYFGKEHNQDTYRSSDKYVEANGTRTFTLTYTLGGNGKRYAGDYPIVVSPFSYVDAADWTKNQMGATVNAGTLKVTHDMNDDGRCDVCGGGNAIRDMLDKLDEKMKFRYKDSEYYKRLLDVEITGDIRKDVIAIAKSQKGNKEGDNNNTEYGNWIGRNNEAWCASFASWCIYMAAYANDVDPAKIVQKTAGASFRMDCFNLSGITGAYDPPQAFTFNQIKDGYQHKEDEKLIVEPGDLVFFTWNSLGNDGVKERDAFDKDNKLPYHTCKDSMEVPIKHVEIVEKFYPNGDGTYTICTIGGNYGDTVITRNEIVKSDGRFSDGTILYFGKPNYDAGK